MIDFDEAVSSLETNSSMKMVVDKSNRVPKNVMIDSNLVEEVKSILKNKKGVSLADVVNEMLIIYVNDNL